MPYALIHCFSGTGNTKICAERVSAGLVKRGYTARILDMESGQAVKPADLHIIMFPVYATAVPHLVARYLRKLPDGKSTKAVVMTTNGRISTKFRDGYQGWALQQARLLLRGRHYDVFFSDTFDLPHNITMFGPPCSDLHNRQIADKAYEALDIAIGRIAAGEKYQRKYFLPNICWSLPLGVLLSVFGRRVTGKLYASTPACSHCGLCAQKCPTKNIKLHRGKPRWGWNCEACMRCINVCPKRAIQLSLLRLVAVIFASIWNPLAFILPGLPRYFVDTLGNVGGWIANFTIMLVLLLIVFTALDWIIYAMAFVPGLNWFSSWGYTALYGRYDGYKLRQAAKKAPSKGI